MPKDKQKTMTTGGKVRRVAIPTLIAFVTYLLEILLKEDGTFDFARFLTWTGSVAGGGYLVWATIEYGEKATVKWWPEGWAGDFKSAFAKALSYGFPVLSYLVTVWLGWQEWSRALMFGAIAAGNQIADTFHQETKPPPEPEKEDPT